MQSLFSDTGVGQINGRIDRLRPDAAAQWGKMSVTQMLAHCQAPLNVGTGSHQLPTYNFLMRFVGNMVKKSILKHDAPFKRNQPTDKSFIVADERNFDTEKIKLKESLRVFSEKGRSGTLNEQHPFFGHLSQNDWDRLQTKHLDHHLRQFGC
jgi:hypothetical protein